MRPLVEEDPEKKTGKEVLDALIVPRQSDLKFTKEKSCFSVQTLMLPWVNSQGHPTTIFGRISVRKTI